MTPSTRKINYAVRSGKHIERSVIVDALRRLDRLVPIEKYDYVGLGGLGFTDHLLIHRNLGLTSLTSIEVRADRDAKRRFAFNNPLRCITLRHGASTAELPKLDWTAPKIVWLDYDGSIDSDTLVDAAQVAGSAAPGSVLIITLNVEPPWTNVLGERAAQLREAVGADAVPTHIRHNAQLGGWKLGGVVRRLALEAIQEALNDRNGPLDPSSEMAFTQLFHFRHEDGAKMLTVGGVLHLAAEQQRIEDAFEDAPHLAKGEDPVEVRAPVLTPREILLLNQQLPDRTRKAVCPGVPDSDVQAFTDFYRWYPTFRAVEL